MTVSGTNSNKDVLDLKSCIFNYIMTICNTSNTDRFDLRRPKSTKIVLRKKLVVWSAQLRLPQKN